MDVLALLLRNLRFKGVYDLAEEKRCAELDLVLKQNTRKGRVPKTTRMPWKPESILQHFSEYDQKRYVRLANAGIADSTLQVMEELTVGGPDKYSAAEIAEALAEFLPPSDNNHDTPSKTSPWESTMVSLFCKAALPSVEQQDYAVRYGYAWWVVNRKSVLSYTGWQFLLLPEIQAILEQGASDRAVITTLYVPPDDAKARLLKYALLVLASRPCIPDPTADDENACQDTRRYLNDAINIWHERYPGPDKHIYIQKELHTHTDQHTCTVPIPADAKDGDEDGEEVKCWQTGTIEGFQTTAEKAVHDAGKAAAQKLMEEKQTREAEKKQIDEEGKKLREEQEKKKSDLEKEKKNSDLEEKKKSDEEVEKKKSDLEEKRKNDEED
jgi:hypothetical protein